MKYLHTALRGVLTDEELKLLPGGFERIGHVAIVSIPPEIVRMTDNIAGALLKLKNVRTVAMREGGISGRDRRPRLRVIAGNPQTETLHHENGCSFKLDVARVMFSTGNIYERERLPKLVGPKEVVVDLFAGVGQFSIPIAKHAEPDKVYAVEFNPIAYGYLRENVRINRVGHIVRPLLGDCAEVAPRGIADRVIMGLLHVTHQYLPLAIEVLKRNGGVIHYHESVPSKLRFERPVKRILEVAAGREVEILNKRVVKRYAPGVDHVVLDVRIGPGHA
ncbi:MAG: class I SAM-dependent methyltransferase family protein [Candidatus Hodarchaeaceae archaeon]|nr:class I SAM-dependent methyltransferase family protein [Candidatus Hodarchaeaceae archaeon]